MAHHNTRFSHILKLVPRHEFESLAKQHHSGRKFRSASRWSQLVALMMAQLSGRNSLQDVILNLSTQAQRLYHLGCVKLTCSNLSRINERKPYSLYEALFGRLLSVARILHRVIVFDSRTSYTPWMHQRLICAWPFFPRLTSAKQKGPSSCMLDSTMMAICRPLFL